jgi:hypothetical protein
MRGRLWVAILYAGLPCAIALAQPRTEHAGVSAVAEASADVAPSVLPPRAPIRVRLDVERTNLGWIARLGLSSLTASKSQLRPSLQNDRR